MGRLSRFRVLAAGTLLATLISSPILAGVLVTGEVLRTARNNAVDPAFAGALHDSTVVGAAVRYLVTDNEATGQEARVGILRAAVDANSYLADARALPSDLSSLNLYRALLACDLLSTGTGLFTPEDREGLRRTCMTVLDHYLDPSLCDWNDDDWALGVSAMRVVASCALYAGVFEDDPAADRFRQHALRYLAANIRDGIDLYGAWTPGSPGANGEIIEYMVVAGKVLRALGFEDMIATPRFAGILTGGIDLLPPRQSPHTRDDLMVSIGRTSLRDNAGAQAMLAVADIYARFPDEASELVWYWHECGTPAGPLDVLFIDTAIPYMRPNVTTTVAGGGTVVFRDRPHTASESMVTAGFGDAPGTPDRERWDHHDAGDFSFVWNGYPVIFHNGEAADAASELLLNRQSWRHSIVLPRGLGDSAELPEPPMVPMTVPADPPQDFYPDGLGQFLSTPLLDYASGRADGGDYDRSVFSNTRHFLFMKPNALVIWDEISAAGPVEWDMWMPVLSASTASNTLNVRTPEGIELQAVFAGETSVKYTADTPATVIDRDWPVLMRAPLGDGTITILSIDAARAVAGDHAVVFAQLVENIAVPVGDGPVGILDGSGTVISILGTRGITVAPFSAGIPEAGELSRFAAIVINPDGSSSERNMLMAARETLDTYVRGGGRLVWIGAGREGIDSGTPDAPGLVPVMLAAGSLPVTPPTGDDTGLRITTAPDQVWTSPHRISTGDFAALVNELCAVGLFSDTGKVPAVTVPPAWSSAWQTIAAVGQAFPVAAVPDTTAGLPTRIRVTPQNAAGGILTLLLPRVQGEPYRYTVTKNSANYIAFSDPVSAWEVATGPTSWTDARLSAKQTGAGGRTTWWAIDCTTLTIGTETIIARHPLTIYYNGTEDRGIIQTAVNNELTFSGGVVTLHAGELSFTNLSANIYTDRETYITRIRVVDSREQPIGGARITLDGSFAGDTGKQGYLPVRWSDYQPAISIRAGSRQSSGLLVPGDMTFILDGFRP